MVDPGKTPEEQIHELETHTSEQFHDVCVKLNTHDTRMAVMESENKAMKDTLDDNTDTMRWLGKLVIGAVVIEGIALVFLAAAGGLGM